MVRWLVLAALLVAGCKKEKRAGLPPAQEWGSPIGSGAPDPNAAGMMPMPPNPHGGMGDLPPDHPPVGGMPPDHPPVAGGGGGGNPHDTMQPVAPEQTAPRTLAKRADGKLTLGPFTLAVPKGWSEKPITSSMRAAHFTLPPAKPGLDAELIVFYFGPEGAGSDQDNIDRWLDQMAQADGKPTKSVAKIESVKLAGQDATTVSATGKYTPMQMGAAPAPEVADAMLLAAIVKSPSGPYYFKLTGAKATVLANEAAFRALLNSLTIAP